MPVHDLPTEDVSTEAIVEAVLRAEHERTSRLPLLAGVPLLVVGVVGLIVALELLDASFGAAKYLLVGVAVAMAYTGLSLVCRAVFGQRFELGLWCSVAWVVTLVMASVFADLLPLRESRDVSRTLSEPIRVRPDLLSSHPLGTDGQGLDVLGGIVYGARVSLTVGFGAVFIGLAVGLAVGIAAGYHRGKLDGAISFITDSMLAFPPLILLLAMVAVLAPSVTSVTAALAIIAIPTYIRLSRANTMVFAQREFVLSARLLGDRSRSIMARELLPNVLLPVVSFSFLIVAVFIVAEASLSFLGLSVSRPNPTWGNMIATGQDRLDEHPHIVFVPGGILFLTVFAFNRIGDSARKRWDPREAKL